MQRLILNYPDDLAIGSWKDAVPVPALGAGLCDPAELGPKVSVSYRAPHRPSSSVVVEREFFPLLNSVEREEGDHQGETGMNSVLRRGAKSGGVQPNSQRRMKTESRLLRGGAGEGHWRHEETLFRNGRSHSW
jgi:hypothetical protein